MFKGLISSVGEFLKTPFNKYLAFCLVVLGAVLLIVESVPQPLLPEEKFVVHVFYLPTCPHCAEQKPIIEELSRELTNVSFAMHDASTSEGSSLFYQMASEAGLDITRLGVPTTFVGKKALIGVHSKNEIIDSINYCQTNCLKEKSEKQNTTKAGTEFEVPFAGKTDLTKWSMPVLAITLGLVDGFNPCAMWVLVYLIALLLEVNDKRKFWLIIGSFILASGVLYFLFMTAWLNAFLLIGYLRPVTILIGLIALGGGILSLKEYFTTKGSLTCKVGDEESHEKTTHRLRHIVSQPLSIAIIFSIIVLAFLVNSVEFACSSAIPAVFTQILALKNIAMIERYLYILLYDLFFMLDDLIIFVLVGLAVSGGIGEKYAKYCKAIGGAIMTALGLLLLFAPQLLR